MKTVVDHSDNESYHARPEVSCSQLKQLRESPLAFYYRHVEKTAPPKQSAALDYGSLLHGWAEEDTRKDFWDKVEVGDPSICTATGAFGAKAKVWLEELDPALIPVSPADYKKLKSQTKQILANPAARELLENSVDREFNITWDWEGHRCRCRVDGATSEEFYDLKTTRDANILKHFAGSVKKFGYHMQAAMYRSAALATGEWPDHRMKFIVTSTEWPYPCEVIRLPEFVHDEGRSECLRLLEELSVRRDLDAWHPSTYGQVHELDCPNFRKREVV